MDDNGVRKFRGFDMVVGDDNVYPKLLSVGYLFPCRDSMIDGNYQGRIELFPYRIDPLYRQTIPFLHPMRDVGHNGGPKEVKRLPHDSASRNPVCVVVSVDDDGLFTPDGFLDPFDCFGE